MAVISGYAGMVNGETSIRSWQISIKRELAEYGSSGTYGAMSALDGMDDWSGSFTGYGDLPAAMPGESLAFVGSIDGSVGAAGTAIVDSVTITHDIEGKKPTEYTVNFSGNGALTCGAAVAADVSVALPQYGGKVALGTVLAEPVWTDETDVRNWNLSITAANAQYASSSTSGGIRRVRGNLTVALSYGVYAPGGLSGLVTPGTVKCVRLYSNASRYWELYWGVFGDVSDVQVNREQVNVVGCTYNLKFRGITPVGGSDTKGHIKDPASATYWP